MNKYWYVIKDREGVHYVGFLYAPGNTPESILIQSLREYVEEKGYKEPVLLAWIVQGLPIINQIYPACVTEESQKALEEVLEVAM